MMIEIAGHVAGDPGRVLFAVAELIPDARPLAVRVPGAFALIGCRRGAPEKFFSH